jgi:AcrR family transcriptional regulator
VPPKRVKPARRRAKQQRARATVDVIREAAAHVLLREGYARATTNRIADVAGVSVGTIYQYFTNKDAIFDALIRGEIDGLKQRLVEASPNPDLPLADALRILLSSIIRARPEAPTLYRALEQVPNGLFRRRVSDARGGVVEWIRGFLSTHRREVRVRDFEVAAFVIVAAAEGIAMNASPEFYRNRGADEVTTLFTRYLTTGSA